MKKLSSIFLIFLILLTLVGCNNPTSPTLDGSDEVTIEVGSTYMDPGLNNPSNLDVTITGQVDTNVVGVYVITYEVEFNDGILTFERTVHVVDTTIPTITLTGGDVSLDVGSTFTDPGFSATDNYDGDITSAVTTSDDIDTDVAGTYTVTYNVADSSGNNAVEVSRNVIVTALDTNDAPVITLTGDAAITIHIFDNYNDAGATASDTEDGDITDDITVVNNVNPSAEGVYTVTYNVDDSEGLAATEVTRTVTVVNDAPVITITDGDITINLNDTFTEPGYSASDTEDGDLTSDVIVVNPVDTTTAGVYTITYNVDDTSGKAATEITRTVTVIDPSNVAPTITLVGGDVTLNVGDTYVEQGATASDTEDGDITDDIVISNDINTNVAGTYTVTYNVTDSQGLAATEVTRTVTVASATNSAPVITLIGNDVTLVVGDTYTDAGATASDAEDGNITNDIVRVSTVNTSVAGTYTVTYNVDDSQGLAATEVIRTVTVVNPQTATGDYTYLYVEQNTTLSWSTILPLFGIDASESVSLDTSILGLTTLTFGTDSFDVVVFERYSVPNILAESVIIMQNMELYDDQEFTLSVVSNKEITISLDAQDYSRLYIQNPNSYSYILDLFGRDMVVTESAFMTGGDYTLYLNSVDTESDLITFYVDEESYTEITIDLDEFTFINTNDLSIIGDLVIDSSGNHGLNLFSEKPFQVIIKDSLDNTIISQEAMLYGYNYYQFDLYQNFAAGTYQIEIVMLDLPSRVSVYAYQGTELNYFGYAYSLPIQINVPTTLSILYDRDWYQLTIPETGWYEFNTLSAIEFLYDFGLYTEDMEFVSYGDNVLYLVQGDYYMNFESYMGMPTIEITKSSGTATSNNDKPSASTLTLDTINDVTFDSDFAKWYTFTLTESEYITFFINNIFFYYDVTFEIWDDQDNVLYNDDYIFSEFNAGTYYVIIHGENGLTVPFGTMTHDLNDLTATNVSPFTLNFETVYETYQAGKTDKYYEFTVVDEKVYQLLYKETSCSNHMELTKGADTLFDNNLYTSNDYYMNLLPGDYQMVISSTQDESCYYQLKIHDASSETWDFSTDSNTTLELKENIDNRVYVNDEDMSVYALIELTTPSLISGYIMNAKAIKVYDQSDTLIVDGDIYYTLPLVLEAGTYKLELISSDAGLITFNEPSFTPIYEFNETFSNPSISGHLYGKRAFDQAPFVDVVEVTISDTKTYQLSTDSDAYFYLLDSDMNEIITKAKYNTYITLEPAVYYLVITSNDPYYEIKTGNITGLKPGEDISTAKEIFINEENKVFINDEYSMGYLEFTVPEDTYLLIDYDDGYYIDIYDDQMNHHNGFFFSQGTYYIEVRQIKEMCYGACEADIMEIDLTNINSAIISNTMTTAIPLEIGEDEEGFLPNIMDSAWYTFTLNDNMMAHFGVYNTSHVTYALYDSNGTYLEDLEWAYQYLEAGTYYIEITETSAKFRLEVNLYDYIEVADSIEEAESLPATNIDVESFVKDSLDEDWYTFTLTEEHFFRWVINNATVYLYKNSTSGGALSTANSSTYINLQAGTYYFRVTYNQPMRYQVQFNIKDELIVSNTLVDAPLIEIETYTQAYAGGYGEVDVFKIIPDSDITITMPGNNYELYDASNTLLTTYNLTGGDTYYLKYTASTYGVYGFTVEEFDPDDVNLIQNDEATPEVLTTPFFTIEDYSDDYNENDWYKFTVTTATLYKISAGYNGRVTIYDDNAPTKNEIMSQSWFGETTQYLEPGTYYIKVGEMWDGSSYNIEFSEKDYTDYSGDINNPSEIDIYQIIESYLFYAVDKDYLEITLQEATILLFDTSMTINVLDTSSNVLHSDIDTTRIYLAAGTYVLELITPSDEVTEYDLVIENHHDLLMASSETSAEIFPLYNMPYEFEGYVPDFGTVYFKLSFDTYKDMVFDCDASYEITRVSDNAILSNATSTWQADTYVIAITKDTSNFFTCSYQYTNDLVRDSLSKEPIELDKRVFAYSYDNTEQTTYTFTPSEDMLISLYYYGKTTISIDVSDNLSNSVHFNSLYGYGDTTSEIYLEGGIKYTITLTGLLGNYHFDITRIPHVDVSDSSVAAKEIGLNRTYNYTIWDQKDIDWFMFEITEIQDINIQTSAGFTVYLSDKTTVLNSYTSLNPGTYYIKITHNSNFDYSLRID